MFCLRRPIDDSPTHSALSPWLTHALFLLALTLALGFTAFLGVQKMDRNELLRRAALLFLRYELQREVKLSRIEVDADRGQATFTGIVVPDLTTRRYPLISAKRAVIRFDANKLWFSPTRPLRAIRAVRVERPFIYAARNPRSKWNFDDLLQRPRKPSKDRFRGAVTITDGEIVYTDALGWPPLKGPLQERLTQINANTLVVNGDYMPFRLSAVTSGKRVRELAVTGGVNLSGDRVSGEVRMAGLKLDELKQLLPARLPFRIDSGSADGAWQFAIERDPKTRKARLATTAVADVRDVKGALHLGQRWLACTVSEGQLRLTQNSVEFVDTRGTVEGLPAQVAGSIANFHQPVLAIQVKTTGVEAARLATLVPGLSNLPINWDGKADGWVQLTGPPKGLHMAGHMRGPSIRSTFGNFAGLEGDFTFTDNTIAFSNVRGQGFSGQLAGKGWIALQPGQKAALLFEGEANNADLHQLIVQYLPPPTDTQKQSALLHDDLHGTVSGPVTIRMDRAGVVNVTAHGQGQAQLAKLTGGAIDADVNLRIVNKEFEAKVVRAQAHLPEGVLQAYGTLDGKTGYHLTVRGGALKLQELAAHANQKNLSGTGVLQGELSGPLDAPVFTGSFYAKDGAAGERKFQDLRGKITADLGPAQKVTLSGLQLLAGGNLLELDGLQIVNFKQPQVTPVGKLVLHRTEVGTLQALAGTNVPLQGILEGEVQFQDSLEKLQGRLELRRPIFTLEKRVIEADSLSARFIRNGSTLQIADGQLVYKGTPIAVEGTITFDEKSLTPQALSLRVKADSLDLDDFTALVAGNDPDMGKLTDDLRVQLPIDVGGSLALEATVNAKLAPDKGEKLGDVLARTLAIDADIHSTERLSVAGTALLTAAAQVQYRGAEKVLALNKLDLRRDGEDGYHIALEEPASLNMDSHEIDLRLALQDLRSIAAAPQPFDLTRFRHDLLTLAANTRRDYQTLRELNDRANGAPALPPALAQLADAAQAVPLPFAGKGRLTVSMAGLVNRPLVSAALSGRELVVGGVVMPNIDGNFTFDTAPRMLTVEKITASGGTDPDATVDLDGTVRLPNYSDDGQESDPGSLDLNLTAQKVDLNQLGSWMKAARLGENSRKMSAMLDEMSGEISSWVTITGTPARPEVSAPVDIVNPGYRNVQFDSLSAIVSLDEKGLWIGRWVKADRKLLAEVGDTATGETIKPMVIGDKMILPEMTSTLRFKGVHSEDIKDLEFAGYLPFRWKGPLKPYVPNDEQIFFSLRLPKQGLNVLRAYLPQLPADKDDATVIPPPAKEAQLLAAFPNLGKWKDAIGLYLTKPADEAGTLEGALEVHGTLENPQLTDGTFRFQAPELLLAAGDRDLPNRMKQVRLDLDFSSTVAEGRRVNVVNVNDLSALFDRTDNPLPGSQKKPNLLERIFGKRKKTAEPIYGAVVAQGAIQIDPQRLLDANGDLLPLTELPNHLDYDLFLKTVRTPLRWRELFKGTVSAYLHLNTARQAPKISGVVYLENSRLAYMAAETPVAVGQISFNPALDIALQAGENNSFEFGTESALASNALSAQFRFMPTAYVQPFSTADLVVTKPGSLGKPAIEREWLPYWYSAKTLETSTGTVGKIEGSLSDPRLSVNYVVQSRDSRMNFPGGVLTVDQGSGDVRFERNAPLRIFANHAEATGMLGEYKISATIDDTDIMRQIAAGHELPLQFETVSSPRGAPPLSRDEIAMRLTGVTDFAAILEGKQQFWSPVYSLTQRWFQENLLSDFSRKLGLESMTLGFNAQHELEATVLTRELAKSKIGAFRLGEAYTFGEQPTWRLWGEYNTTNRLFRNFSIVTDLNSQREFGVNLQYRWEF